MADLVLADPEATALDAADPVEYMAVALNRAKGWLAEARSIEDVRETKAIAVGYESVIREKELAFDAQLSATEIVRRCERRIGELVRHGQRQGTVARPGDIGGDPNQRGLQRGVDLATTSAAAGVKHPSELTPLYTMADARDEEFEKAIGEARAEGNLSRANVVRKVKGEAPKTVRSEWHRKRRRIDSNRILRSLAETLDGATAGLELMGRDEIDPDTAAECVPAIEKSLADIRQHVRRIQ